MKRVILATAFVALLGSAGMGWGADFQKGAAAYQRGDYATALHEWALLANQGLDKAQYALCITYYSAVIFILPLIPPAYAGAGLRRRASIKVRIFWNKLLDAATAQVMRNMRSI